MWLRDTSSENNLRSHLFIKFRNTFGSRAQVSQKAEDFAQSLQSSHMSYTTQS